MGKNANKNSDDEPLSQVTKDIIHEFEEEIDRRIKVARFQGGVQATFMIVENLLANGKLSLKEISEVCGFSTKTLRDFAAKRLFAIGNMTFEEIAKFCKLSVKKVRKLVAQDLIEGYNATNFEKVADICGLPLEEIQKLAATK